jgi:hypothetical protein
MVSIFVHQLDASCLSFNQSYFLQKMAAVKHIFMLLLLLANRWVEHQSQVYNV